MLGVQHLGVELHPRQPPVGVLEGRDRGVSGAGDDVEPLRRDRHRVVVRHPHRLLAGQAVEQGRVGAEHLDRRTAELGGPGARDRAAERQRHRLEAVADAERRDAGREHGRVDRRGARGVDRGGTAGQDDGGRSPGEHLLDRHRVRHDLAVDPRLADPAGDELRVLRAEVDDQDRGRAVGRRGRGRLGGAHRVILPRGTAGPGRRNPVPPGCPDDVPSINVRRLPLDDPGTPDLRSPMRYLLWTGRKQWDTLTIGVIYGVIWMVAQALVPFAIGRGLQTGVADQDLGAAGRWSLVVLLLAVIQAVFGILRHRMAVTNWLSASFRAMQLLGRHSAAGRRRDPAAAADRRGRRRRDQRHAAHRQRLRRHRPDGRRARVLRRGRRDPAERLGDARRRRAARRTRDGAAARAAAAAVAAAAGGAARDRRAADLARRGHGRRTAGPARHRWRAGVPRPLPGQVRGAARRRGARRVAAGLDGLGSGAAARHLPGPRHLAQCPARARGQ